MSETYNPAQQKVIDMLGKAEARPDIPPSLADQFGPSKFVKRD